MESVNNRKTVHFTIEPFHQSDKKKDIRLPDNNVYKYVFLYN